MQLWGKFPTCRLFGRATWEVAPHPGRCLQPSRSGLYLLRRERNFGFGFTNRRGRIPDGPFGGRTRKAVTNPCRSRLKRRACFVTTKVAEQPGRHQTVASG